MDRALCSLLVAFAATAWAGDGSAQLEACNEQLLDCKENCTIDYGTSVKLRTQLMKCVKKCSKKHASCQEHTLELQQAGIEIPDETPKKKEEPRTPNEASPPAVEEKPVAKEEAKPEPVAEKVEAKEQEPSPPVDEKKVAKKESPPAEKAPAKVEEKPKKRKALDEWDEGDIDR